MVAILSKDSFARMASNSWVAIGVSGREAVREGGRELGREGGREGGRENTLRLSDHIEGFITPMKPH